jgi:SAM-dependent methyltransferase
MNPPPNFSPLARLYRWMEYFTFGPFLQFTRTAFLRRLTRSRRALVLGDGDGRFTARLLRANSAIQIDAVDSSSSMLAALTRRAGPQASRIRTHLADIRFWQPLGILESPGARAHSAAPLVLYDLVATHFFLDCLSTAEVAALAARLRPALAPSALWVVSEFAIPPGWQGSLIARPLIKCLYLSFGLLTGLAVRALPGHSSALRAAGFTLLNRRSRLAGILVSELWSAGPLHPASTAAEP